MAGTFRGGRNIALKVPPHQWEATVRFYRDILGLDEITENAPEVVFQFGHNQLWIDKVETVSQAELWLELVTDDVSAAADHFKAAGIARCDEIEKLPDALRGFWISSPSSIIHLVSDGE